MLKTMLILIVPMVTCAMAQTTFQEQAARLQNINAYLLDFRAASAPRTVEEVSLEAIFELTPQPSVDARVGAKDEDIDPPNLVPKLRGRVVFPSGWMVGAAFAPGLEFEGYKASYVAVELGWRTSWDRWLFGARGSWLDGDVEGPVTEPELDDAFGLTNFGMDLSLGRVWRRWSAYGFAGWNEIETHLDIALDGVHLDNSDGTYYGGAGLNYRLGSWSFNAEQHITDDYLAHAIVSVSFLF